MTADLVERLRDYAVTGNRPSLWPHAMREAADEIERLRAECEEQARLNGMGAERELRLRAEVEHLQHDIANYQRIVRTAEPGDNRIPAAELERIAQADEIEWLRATVNRVIEELEMAVFCDGHTRLQPCEPECHCVQHYDAVRELIR